MVWNWITRKSWYAIKPTNQPISLNMKLKKIRLIHWSSKFDPQGLDLKHKFIHLFESNRCGLRKDGIYLAQMVTKNKTKQNKTIYIKFLYWNKQVL